MISQAFALAIITFGGFWIIYSKLPEKVKEFINKHSLLSDIACLSGAYVLLGGTLTALFGAALVGLMVSAALYIGNNKEDFSYLYDFADMAKDKLQTLKVFLKEAGQSYNARRIK